MEKERYFSNVSATSRWMSDFVERDTLEPDWRLTVQQVVAKRRVHDLDSIVGHDRQQRTTLADDLRGFLDRRTPRIVVFVVAQAIRYSDFYGQFFESERAGGDQHEF
jgi:hypothetical protein